LPGAHPQPRAFPLACEGSAHEIPYPVSLANKVGGAGCKPVRAALTDE